MTPDGNRSSSTQDTGLREKTTSDSAIYKSEYSRQTGGLGQSSKFAYGDPEDDYDESEDNYGQSAIVKTQVSTKK